MSNDDPQDKSIQSVEQLLAHALAMEVEAVERYETLADQMYVKNLEILAQKLDQHYHAECKKALQPVLAQIASEEDAGYHRGTVKGLARMNEKLAEYVASSTDQCRKINSNSFRVEFQLIPTN